jgi:methionine-gamma-lyase
MTKQKDPYRKQTRLIQGKLHSAHWNYQDHIVPPISASVAYRLESAARGAEGFREFANPEFNRELQPPIYIYDRLDEPSRGMLEENLELAEGGEVCVTFASGMASIAAALGVLMKSGDTLLSHHTIYGCTYSLFTNWLPRLGIKVLLEDLTDPDRLRALLDSEPEIMVVFGETPCNPSLDLLDLAEISRIMAEHNSDRAPCRRVYTVVDNTFATPFCQRPLEHGIDVVVQSLTKNIGGFGTDMGGAVVGPRLLEPDLLLYRKDFGSVLAPRAAWSPLVYGLPTLALRTREQMATALRVAQFLEQHPRVARVSYPGLQSHPQHALARRQMRDFDGEFAPGVMVYFVLKGGGEAVRGLGARVIDHIAEHALSVTLAVSLGQIRTLIEHPSSMTHASVPAAIQEQSHIDPGGIRLSMGLEHPDDIIADLSAALESI